ncbi:MAG: hypothetical protein EOO80_18905, partial [Oxalobacteraceae bacterium]
MPLAPSAPQPPPRATLRGPAWPASTQPALQPVHLPPVPQRADAHNAPPSCPAPLAVASPAADICRSGTAARLRRRQGIQT